MRIGPNRPRLPRPAPEAAPARAAPARARPLVVGHAGRLPVSVATPAAPSAWDKFNEFMRSCAKSIHRMLHPGFSAAEAPHGIQVQLNGTHESYAQRCQENARLMVTRPDILKNLRAEKVTCIIVPSGMNVTDIPEFRDLKGKGAIDGGGFDDALGIAGGRQGDRYVFAVKEDTFAQSPIRNPCPGQDAMMHELAHAIHENGITREERLAIIAAYDTRVEAGGPFTDSYGATNEYEYFAQATSTFFRRNGLGENDPAWLKKNDPAIYAVLTKIYGQPPAK